jgi:peptidoglycan/LPS O-acetylase OafA/YrhL
MTTGAPSNITEQAGLQRVALHPTAASHRFHLLDALRGIAALLIVFYHVVKLLPFYHVTKLLPHSGSLDTYLAVDFFFCLSGFVIAFSYEQRLAVAPIYSALFWVSLSCWPITTITCMGKMAFGCS